MSGTRKHMPPGPRVEGVFVLGMDGSGAELVHALLCHLGLHPLGGAPAPESLAAFNDRLLATVSVSGDPVPKIAPGEAARVLRGHAGEARQLVLDVDHATQSTGAWVWADPRNSFLATFWSEALSVNPAVILVHREPQEVLASLGARGPDQTAVLEQWAGYNRAAIVHCSELPALVIGYDELRAQPKTGVLELAEFMEQCGVPVTGGMEEAVEIIERLPRLEPSPDDDTLPIDSQYRVLARVLDRLDGRHTGDSDEANNAISLIDATSQFYDEDYYGTSYDKSGVPYRRDEQFWVDFFEGIASSIVDTLGPRTSLDMGCAIGMLVEALRDRGVDARGIDASTWAIAQVPEALRPFCRVGSITEELEDHYDLITCIEVLEHVPPSLAPEAVANLCRHAEAVLFSSTPDDFDEPTHLNVEPGGYWAQLFFRQGFIRDVDYDASFLVAHAVLFRRQALDVDALITHYERGLSNTTAALGARVSQAVAEHERLAARYNALGAEGDRLASALGDLGRRRAAEAQAAFDTLRQYEAGQRRLAALVEMREAEINAIHQTKVFRYSATLRGIYGRLRSRGRPVELPAAPAHPPDGSYELWVEQFDTLDDAIRGSVRDRVARLDDRPLISVIMPVYDPPPHLLRAAIDSVRAQLYEHWELCIADDCSTDSRVAEVLREYEAEDSRIKVVRREVNGHISAASNTALGLATGVWLAGVDHDDVLAEHALALVVLALAEHPDPGIVYSDEDKIDDVGSRQSPYFKPDFDPLLLIGQNYLNHLCVFRRDLVTEVGGYREGYEGSQDWDLALRVSERLRPEQVIHVPHVLYHWRSHAGSTASLGSAKPYAVDAGRRAAVDHLARTGRAGRVTRIPKSGHNRVTWEVPDPAPRVSIIIPTRDGSLLQRCIDSLFAFTTYPDFDITVIDNSSRTRPTLEFLRAHDDRVRVIRDERPFNYSAINNAGVRQTTGEIVCLLNDDTEVIAGDWLTELVGHVLQPGVGAAGAKLYYDDGRIQHAGVVLGIQGVAGHAYRLFDRLSSGYFGRLQLAQHLSGVTAACVVVRRQAWHEVGGLDEENLPIAFNDVDFGLRLREAGWGIVWSPYAELFHHESVSRGPDDSGPRATEFAREVSYMQARWGPEVLRYDPYYNPNLSLVAEDFSLAWPPRVSYP